MGQRGPRIGAILAYICRERGQTSSFACPSGARRRDSRWQPLSSASCGTWPRACSIGKPRRRSAAVGRGVISVQPRTGETTLVFLSKELGLRQRDLFQVWRWYPFRDGSGWARSPSTAAELYLFWNKRRTGDASRYPSHRRQRLCAISFLSLAPLARWGQAGLPRSLSVSRGWLAWPCGARSLPARLAADLRGVRSHSKPPARRPSVIRLP